MLVRFRYTTVFLGLLGALGCGSGGTGAGEVLVVADVEISPPGLSLVAGTTGQLIATPKTSSGIPIPNRRATWSSDDQGVATVSDDGLVTGVSAGSTSINAVIDGVRASASVIVSPEPVATVSVVPAELALMVGAIGDLAVTPRNARGDAITGRPVTFSSDNPLIATVSTSGRVTALGVGLTVITATVEGKSGTVNVAVSELPASELEFQNQPATGAAGSPIPAVRVEVRNNQGGMVTEGDIPVTIALADNPATATLSGTLTVLAQNGVATFSDLRINQAGTGYTLRATSGTLDPAVSAPFAIVPGTASRLTIATQPAPTTTSGAPLTIQPRVQIRDADGNPVTQAGVQVTVALEGMGATLGGTPTVSTNAEGIASFSGLSITGSLGTYTLLFAAPGLIAIASDPITLTSGPPARLGVAQQPGATGQSGVPLTRQPMILVQDIDGNIVAQAGIAVTASIQSGGGVLGGTTTVLTGADGLARFTNLAIDGPAGTRVLLFTSPSISPVSSEPIVILSGPAAALSITTQPPSTTESGAVLSPAPIVQVVDASGTPVDPDVEIVITATIASGSGGALGGTTSVTSANGVGLFSGLILTGPAGSYTVRFSAGGLTAAVSQAISIAGPTPVASRLVLAVAPSATAASGTAFTTQPAVQIADAGGAPVSQGGTTVTAVIASGPSGATLANATATSNASGRAVFSGLAITGPAGTYTLRFESGSLTPVTSGNIALTASGPGPATALSLTTQPATTAVSGEELTRQPIVQLRDGSGNPVSQSGVAVAVSIASGGGTLGGTTTRTTGANGQAVFTDLSITGTAGARTLRFSASGLTGVTSGTIDVTVPATAARLVLVTQPASSAVSGTALATQPVVQVADAGGAAVPQSGTTISAEIASGPGGATLSGATAVSNSSGRATFSGLTITGPAGTYTLRFEAGSLTPVTSGNIALGGGSASTISIPTQPPASAVNDAEFAGNVIVRVQDASGNGVGGLAIIASVESGDGVLQGTLTRTTAADGRATFDNLKLLGLVGTYTLRFAAPGGLSVTSRAVTLSAGAGTQLSITTQPSSTVASGATLARDPVIQVRDRSGNASPQSGVEVGVSIASGGGTLGGDANRSTGSAGQVTFPDLRITGSPGDRTLRFSAAGLTGVTSAPIEVTAPLPASITIVTQPPATAVSGTEFSGNSVVEVRDATGNGVAGATVTVSVASGPGQVQGTLTRTTGSNGQATFDNLALVGPSGTYTLRFSVGGVSVVSRAISLENLEGQILFIVTQPPSDAVDGRMFDRDPRIEIRDANGDRVQVDAVIVTAGLETISGSGSLGGATARETKDGVAVFQNLRINGTGTFRIRFTSPGRASVTSIIIEVDDGDDISVSAQPPEGSRDARPRSSTWR